MRLVCFFTTKESAWQQTLKKRIKAGIDAVARCSSYAWLGGVAPSFFFKGDFAAWIFVAIFAAIGCGICVFLTAKVHKLFVGADAWDKPKFALGLSIFQTVLTLGACAVILVGTLYSFLY